MCPEYTTVLVLQVNRVSLAHASASHHVPWGFQEMCVSSCLNELCEPLGSVATEERYEESVCWYFLCSVYVPWTVKDGVSQASGHQPRRRASSLNMDATVHCENTMTEPPIARTPALHVSHRFLSHHVLMTIEHLKSECVAVHHHRTPICQTGSDYEVQPIGSL